jgi:cysteine-rich repeat protein
MASVYIAHDDVLEVHRAIKLLAPRLCTNQRVRQRFVDEARAMARMRHPNIVTVHDVAIEGGEQPYIIMELVHGGSVGDLIEVAGAQPPEVAGPIMLNTLQGLQCAHDSGVVHRDIKPDNVLLTRGGVAKLTDFGIAHIEATDHAMTRTGAVLGTIAYMAPEQRRDSKSVTLQADLYAAGCMLFALLKGSDPFDLYAKELQDSQLGDVPESLREVICTACSFEPANRYASAVAMAEAIEQAMESMGVEISPDRSVQLPELLREMSGGWNADSDIVPRRASAETSNFSQTSMNLLLSQSGSSPVSDQSRRVPLNRVVIMLLTVTALGAAALISWVNTPPPIVCGDGVVGQGEECDDGNAIASDTCTNECALNVVFLHGAAPSGGHWLMGSEEPFNDRADAEVEIPATPIALHPFWMDRHEVTREAYLAWLETHTDRESNAPDGWEPGTETHAANSISHAYARRYCQSLGGDTPSEGHWEYAARSGGKNNTYPWGDEEPTCDLAILGRHDCSFGRVHPVCSRPKGNTEQGICDMAGNVWEWTRTMFPQLEDDEYPRYAGKPKEVEDFHVPDREISKGYWEAGMGLATNKAQSDRVDVIRGGGFWMTVPFYNRTRARYFIKKGKYERNVGFRCMYGADRFDLPIIP